MPIFAVGHTEFDTEIVTCYHMGLFQPCPGVSGISSALLGREGSSCSSPGNPEKGNPAASSSERAGKSHCTPLAALPLPVSEINLARVPETRKFSAGLI